MDDQEYISERLDPAIDWYDRKGGTNKIAYYGLKVTELIAAGGIPFLAILMSPEQFKPIAGSLGFLIMIAAAFLSLFKPQEKWLHYRTTCETLRQHKHRFLAGAPPYTGRDMVELVNRAEAIISTENTDWTTFMLEDSESDAKDANGTAV